MPRFSMPFVSRTANAISCVIVCLLFIGFCNPPALAQRDDQPAKEGLLPTDGLPVVGWNEASQVVGRRAVVYGKIIRVGQAKGISFLNFDNGREFTGVIFEKSDAAFKEAHPDKTYEELYLNKKVAVLGTVSVFKGAPQIVIARPDQIAIVEEYPATRMVDAAKVEIGEELRIGSYNIENLFDANDDPYHNDEGTAAKPRDEMKRVAGVIKEINLDVIALQEVESRGYLQRFIDAMLPEMGYDHVVHYEGNDGRGIDVCLVSRIPVGEVTSHRHHVFKAHDGGDQKFGRDLLRVELLPDGGQPFEMWIVHLKSNSGGKELNEPIRLGECHEVHRLVAKRLKEDPDVSLILCGDFNDEFETKTIQTILGDPPMLKTIFDDIPEDERITYNRKPYRSMIDFLLCSPAMAERFVPGSFTIRPGIDTETGSDHNPIYARFKKGAAVTNAETETPTRNSVAIAKPTGEAVEPAVEPADPPVEPAEPPAPSDIKAAVNDFLPAGSDGPTVTHAAATATNSPPKRTRVSILGLGVLGLGVLGVLAIGTLLVSKAS